MACRSWRSRWRMRFEAYSRSCRALGVQIERFADVSKRGQHWSSWLKSEAHLEWIP